MRGGDCILWFLTFEEQMINVSYVKQEIRGKTFYSYVVFSHQIRNRNIAIYVLMPLKTAERNELNV